MKFENLEKFKEFLDENLNASVYDLDACLTDLERQIGETGADHYELSASETRSSRPEIISFDRVDQADGDDFITIIAF